MKKTFMPLIFTVSAFVLGSSIVCATGAPLDTVSSATSSTQTTVTPTSKVTATPFISPNPISSVTLKVITNKTAGITPDSLFYPLERLIESVYVTFTFSKDGKADLLVNFANERLAEAKALTENNKSELIQKTLDAYVTTIAEANKSLKDAVIDNKNVEPIIKDIKAMEESSGDIIVNITKVIPKEKIDNIVNSIANEVKKTLAVETFSLAQKNFHEAKDSFKKVQEELQKAKKSGDNALIIAAQDKVIKAEQYKKEMEKLKDEAEKLKEEVKEKVQEHDKKEKINPKIIGSDIDLDEDKEVDKDDVKDTLREHSKDNSLKSKVSKELKKKEKMETKFHDKYDRKIVKLKIKQTGNYQKKKANWIKKLSIKKIPKNVTIKIIIDNKLYII